ncbi:hypothetical protein QJS10_CPA08g00499 [Acorus calamus]|uniref:TF-B3 domain-containing protein n=1 Tax=Acorus calamus TaxID=4465 RepID=A0AAV9EFK1_ACOCL|nr:hypothetical protein QJS10_CPA08g00499 [Acorus calamus]
MTGRERKTCKECKERCLIYHQWGEEEEEKPMSFFKILIGSSFSKFLTIMILGESASRGKLTFKNYGYIPPEASHSMEFMVDKNTFLEHSSGKYWNVKVSMVDGFLAFHEGWSAFVSDNSLEVGEMIVFRYLGGSHFTVEIFDKTACEKPFTSKKKDDNKRKQKMTEPSSVDGSPHVPVGPLDDEKIVCKNSNENINSKRARLTKGSSHKSVEQAKSRVTTDGISKEENIEEIPTEEKSRCFEVIWKNLEVAYAMIKM